MNNLTKKSKLSYLSIPKAIINILIFAYSMTCILPLLWLLNSSLRTNGEFMANIAGLATEPLFENYVKAIEIGKMDEYLFNSAYLTVITVIIGTFLAFVVGYCLSRYRFHGRNFVYYMFIAGMIVPTLSLLIPVFMQFKLLGLRDKWYTLLFPYIAYSLPMASILIESYVKTVPKELDESAVIDGCSKWNLMFKIVFPLCKSVLSIVVILNFMGTWNEFPFALVLLNSQELFPVSIGIKAFNQIHTMDYPLFMAALVVATIPIIAIYSVFSKKIMEGMTMGAVKG